jgi:hypothetical protein
MVPLHWVTGWEGAIAGHCTKTSCVDWVNGQKTIIPVLLERVPALLHGLLVIVDGSDRYWLRRGS